MSRFEFRLPDIGEGVAEAELIEWMVDPGGEVLEDQPVATVMTDKAAVELESPVSGTIIERIGKAGETIRVGAVLLTIETEDATSSVPETKPAPEPAEGVPPPSPAPRKEQRKMLATPVVRRRARDLGIDLGAVPHEGSRIMNADLDAFINMQKRSESRGTHGELADRDVPVIGLRRAIARRMEASKRRIPHFTYVEEIDMTECERLRGVLNARNTPASITQLPLLAHAICRILPEFPQFNAHYDDMADVVHQFGAVHLGIAAQTEGGLMVPVVRDAQAMSLWELARAIATVARDARSGKISRDLLQGSTLTISSLGRLGGIMATPIINAPEVCIVAPNRIVERPMWIDGNARPRKMMNVSVSCDHRVIDGYDAAAFVQALKQRLETPALIFVRPPEDEHSEPTDPDQNDSM